MIGRIAYFRPDDGALVEISDVTGVAPNRQGVIDEQGSRGETRHIPVFESASDPGVFWVPLYGSLEKPVDLNDLFN